MYACRNMIFPTERCVLFNEVTSYTWVHVGLLDRRRYLMVRDGRRDDWVEHTCSNFVYMDGNRIKASLEAYSQQRMVVEATIVETIRTCEIGENPILDLHRLDCIYNNEPLGFKKYSLASNKRILDYNQLEEVDLWDEKIKNKRT